MKIFSSDTRSWLRIERTKTGEYVGFEVEARIDVGHGRFHVQNDDVQWLNVADFAAELETFVLNRSVSPRLEGTYDSFLKIRAFSNLVNMEFAIGDTFCGNRTHEYLFEGSFEIDQETLGRLVREFEALSNDN